MCAKSNPGFSDAERGIDDRGTDSVDSHPTLVDFPPTIGPLAPENQITPKMEMDFYREAQQANKNEKNKWKSDNPTWPFSASLRNESDFIFSDEEIRLGALTWLEWFPGLGGLFVTLMTLIEKLRKALSSSNQNDDDDTWLIVAQVTAMITLETATRKIKVREAKNLLLVIFKELGLDDKIGRLAAKQLIWVQKVVRSKFDELSKQAEFIKMSASAKGIKWDKEVKKILVSEGKRLGKNNRNSFWFSFEPPLALGSGKHHPGPNIDIVFKYRKKELFWIDLKLSESAVRPNRSQTFMMVYRSTSLDGLYLYMTPRHFVILPGVAGGVPLSFEVF